MNPLRREVTVGHKVRVIAENRRQIESEKTVKLQSEVKMERNTFN
jgi:hypothetical protein